MHIIGCFLDFFFKQYLSGVSFCAVKIEILLLESNIPRAFKCHSYMDGGGGDDDSFNLSDKKKRYSILRSIVYAIFDCARDDPFDFRNSMNF